MLDCTPKTLWTEIQAAESVRDEYLRDADRLTAQMAGRCYPSQGATERMADQPENFGYEFVSLMLPLMGVNNMRYRAMTGLPGEQSATVFGLVASLNRWAKMSNLSTRINLAALDMFFCFGAMLTVFEPVNGSEWMDDSRGDDLILWPNCYHIPADWYFHDHLASDPSSSRYRGHRSPIDVDDLVRLGKEHADEGWNPEEIAKIGTSASMTDLDRRHEGEGGVDRKEVVIYEVWVPEHVLPDSLGTKHGFHGTVFTLVNGGSGACFVRKPRPYWGPRWGPYTFVGGWNVRKHPYPLAPLVATSSQVEELNLQAKAANRAARQYRRMVICSSDNPDLMKMMTEQSDALVLPVVGFEKDKVVNVEIGGITEQQLAQIQVLRERVERVAGLSEAQQGRPDPNVSATADSIANQASTQRTGWLRNQVRNAATQVGKTAAWFMLHDERFIISLGSDVNEAMGVPMGDQVLYQGGDAGSIQRQLRESMQGNDPRMVSAAEQAAIDDLLDEIEIEALSMDEEGRSRLQTGMMQAVNMVATFAPMIPQTDWMDWAWMFDLIGQATGVPNLSRAVDMALAQQAAASGRAPNPVTTGLKAVGNVGSKAQPGTTRGGSAGGQGKMGNPAGRMAGGGFGPRQALPATRTTQ